MSCPLRFVALFPVEHAKSQHENAVGKETTFVRTALRLHVRAFYSTVHSQPQPGVCVPTALPRKKATRRTARAACSHRDRPAWPRPVPIAHP